MNKIKKVFKISFLIIAILSSFINIFYGLDFLDTFYMGNLFISDNIDIFRPITNIIYLVVLNIFGDYIILFRAINWSIYVLSAILFYRFLQSFHKIPLIWLALTILSIPLIGTNVYNGNSLTLLGIVTTFICLYKYIHSNSIYTLLGLTLSLTLCIGSRFPNIVIIPILLVLSPLICNTKKQYLYISYAIISSIILFLIFNAVIYGGISDYIVNIKSKFISSENHTSGANHSITFLVQEYLHTIKDTVSNIKYLSILFLLPIFSLFVSNKVIRFIIILLFIFLNLVYIYIRVPIVSDVIHYFYMMYLYALVFILIFTITSLSILSKSYKQLGWIIVILLFSSVGASGADTGIYYMGAPLLVFLPLLYHSIFEQLKCINKKNVIAIILSLIGLTISSIIYVRNGMIFWGIGFFIITLLSLFIYSYIPLDSTIFNGKLLSKLKISNETKHTGIMTITFILILVSIGLYAEYKKTFHDKSVDELCVYNNINKLKYIVTNSQSNDFINHIMEEYQKLSTNNDVVFYGRNSAIFSYITRTGIIEGVDFSQNDSEFHTKKVEEAIKGNKVLILTPYNPAINNGNIIDDYPLLINMLKSKGYNYDFYNEYAIFYPSKD